MDITFQLDITGECDVERGPLGRFLDLACEIEQCGGVVPEKLTAVLNELQEASEQE